MDNLVSKDEFIERLQRARDLGWVRNRFPGNDGAVGNTLEDICGIEENNLPIPDAAEWELKTKRRDSGSLTTLLHMDPSPRSARIVPSVLLPKYGWRHRYAGERYPDSELSFRQTISANRPTDRGFQIGVLWDSEKVVVSFDQSKVGAHHNQWLDTVRVRAGSEEIDPQPYWGFDDLFHRAATKLSNCFFVIAERKIVESEEWFRYDEIRMLRSLSKMSFFQMVEVGGLKIDFDARTGHNHGTKFRINEYLLPEIYAESGTI